jgi:mRNA interferase MazF
METHSMDRGEVWWADLPAPVGRRPVLILTRSAAVIARNQVVVAEITRTVHNIAAEVALTRADGMPRDCVVNCDVLITVPKARLIRSICTLSSTKMADVHQAISFALELS